LEIAMEVIPATTREQIEEARGLFVEYAESLGFSLCFQGFDRELAELPGVYAPPGGRLYLAMTDSAQEHAVAGCVALRRTTEDHVCEMKRLYVRPQFRGRGAGGALVDAVIRAARELGYWRMRLDTIEPQMKQAVALYRRVGFQEIAPYRENPIAGALYMELELEDISRGRGDYWKLS
jgi:ribosomal protein S18 acetylase RimI-like enzyme